MKPYRTDIAIFSKATNGVDVELTSAFEMKIFISSSAIAEEMIDRLRYLIDETDALVYTIIFSDQYKKDINNFLREYPGRAFAIGKKNAKFDNQVTLKEAVCKLVGRV